MKNSHLTKMVQRFSLSGVTAPLVLCLLWGAQVIGLWSQMFLPSFSGPRDFGVLFSAIAIGSVAIAAVFARKQTARSRASLPSSVGASFWLVYGLLAWSNVSVVNVFSAVWGAGLALVICVTLCAGESVKLCFTRRDRFATYCAVVLAVLVLEHSDIFQRRTDAWSAIVATLCVIWLVSSRGTSTAFAVVAIMHVTVVVGSFVDGWLSVRAYQVRGLIPQAEAVRYGIREIVAGGIKRSVDLLLVIALAAIVVSQKGLKIREVVSRMIPHVFLLLGTGSYIVRLWVLSR